MRKMFRKNTKVYDIVNYASGQVMRQVKATSEDAALRIATGRKVYNIAGKPCVINKDCGAEILIAR